MADNAAINALISKMNEYEIPRIVEEDGMCRLEMDYSHYSITWPKDKIYERKVYRHDEYRKDQSFDNCIFDLLMGLEDTLKLMNEMAEHMKQGM